MAARGSVIPVIVCSDISATHDYLVEVFGFDAGGVHRDGDGRPVHGEVRMGESRIWLHAVSDAHGMAAPRPDDPSTGGTVVYVDDVDAHFARSSGAGARIDSTPTDQEYGQREYGARDPEGHRWWFATPLGEGDALDAPEADQPIASGSEFATDVGSSRHRDSSAST